jgi:hypothetical protein
MISFRKEDAKLVQILRHGVHAGWLDRYTRVLHQGLHHQRVTTWEGSVCGNPIKEPTLTRAKAKAREIGG